MLRTLHVLAAVGVAIVALSGATPAAAADIKLRGPVIHRLPHASSFVIATGGRMITVYARRLPATGATVTVVGRRLSAGRYAARRVERARAAGGRSPRVKRVTFAGTVTYVNRAKHLYTVSAGAASMAVHVRGRLHRRLAPGRRVRVVASLRSSGRLTQRRLAVHGRVRRITLTAALLGAGPLRPDGHRTVYLSADDRGESRSAMAFNAPRSLALPAFALVAGTASLRASFDWERHGAIDLGAPPRTTTSDPPMLVTAVIGADGGASIVTFAISDGRALAGGDGGNAGADAVPIALPPDTPTPPSGPAAPLGVPELYSATSPWNTPVGASPVASNSAQLVGAIADNGQPLTSDPDQYAIPVYTYDAASPRATVEVSGYFSSYDAGDDSRVGYGDSPTITGVPVPAGAVQSEGSDGQIVFFDPVSKTEYSFWQWSRSAGGTYTATNGYRYHTSAAYGGRFADGLAGRGAGLPYLAGLVRPWEVAQGHIDHALAFAYASPAPSFVYPASKTDGDGVAGTDVPEGARLQLDPAVTDAQLTAWGLSPTAKIVARALQVYGMYVVDNSGSSKIYLEDRLTAHWDASVTRDLVAGIPWSAFRVVAPPAKP